MSNIKRGERMGGADYCCDNVGAWAHTAMERHRSTNDSIVPESNLIEQRTVSLNATAPVSATTARRP